MKKTRTLTVEDVFCDLCGAGPLGSYISSQLLGCQEIDACNHHSVAEVRMHANEKSKPIETVGEEFLGNESPLLKSFMRGM